LKAQKLFIRLIASFLGLIIFFSSLAALRYGNLTFLQRFAAYEHI